MRVLAGLVMALCCCAAGARAQPADWDKLVAAARSEGQVVLYSSLGGPVQDALAKAFQARYGIRVTQLQGRASEVQERIRTEESAGRVLGDVVQQGEATLDEYATAGTIVPHGDLPGLANLAPQFPATPAQVPTVVFPYALLVNTRLVKPDDEPKSWNDLLDPRWKGRILSDDLRTAGAGQVFFEAAYTALGPAFLEKLAAQHPVVTRDNREAERRVARGEFPLYMPQILAYALELKGLPVKFVVPSEGASFIRFDAAVLKGAPHPNAARLFIDFLIGQEAQVTMADGGYFAVVSGIADKVQPDMRPYQAMKLMGTQTFARRAEMQKAAADIFK